ncbi:MAG: SDR family NAD(P)-dependent oxidoreductase [Bacillota bacterium]|jgi:3-oxoacyl-[acyl-carrier protein] reductase
MSFAGKVAVVTGAGSGIGQAVSQVLAGEGALVTGLDVSDERVKALAGPLEERGGRAFKVDVSDSFAVDQAFEEALKRCGRLDFLVNNAGFCHESALDEMSDDDWNHLIAVHLSGAFYCCRAAIPHLRKTRGSIVNMSSIYGMVGAPRYCHYSAAKAGLMGFTKALAKELLPDRVRVNALAPGSVMTPLQDHLDPKVLQAKMEAHPWGRYATPEEIAGYVLFLLSDKCDYLTGQVISPSGGQMFVGI